LYEDVSELKKFESVESWLMALRAAGKAPPGSITERAYLRWLDMFCDFSGLNPDEIVRQVKNPDDMWAVQKFRQKLNEFVVFLQERRGYQRNTIAQAVAAIQSFLSYNGVAVKYPFTWVDSAEPRLPTPEELVKIYDALEKVCRKHLEEVRAFMLIAKDSGLSANTILNLTWDRPQAAGSERPYPSIAEQLETGVKPIHIRVMRKKTEVKHDSFLGEEAIRELKILYEESGGIGRIIPLRDDYIRHRLLRACKVAKVYPVSPQLLRKFFITRMKLAPVLVKTDLPERYRVPYDVWNAIVEYMAEHIRPKVERTYFKPFLEILGELYEAHYDAIRIFPKK